MEKMKAKMTNDGEDKKKRWSKKALRREPKSFPQFLAILQRGIKLLKIKLRLRFT